MIATPATRIGSVVNNSQNLWIKPWVNRLIACHTGSGARMVKSCAICGGSENPSNVKTMQRENTAMTVLVDRSNPV